MEIFAHDDYRNFLREHRDEMKRTKPGWSLTVWARTLGLRSPSTLLMILQGQRNPSELLVAKLCEYFHFGPEERNYFASLVRLSKYQHDNELSTLLRRFQEEDKLTLSRRMNQRAG